MNDTQRAQKERLQRMVEETIAYVAGTAIFFVVSPISGLFLEKLVKDNKKVAFWTASIGSLFSTLYSGLWADKVAQKFVENFPPVKERMQALEQKNGANPFAQAAISSPAVSSQTTPSSLDVTSQSAMPSVTAATASQKPLPSGIYPSAYNPLHIHPHYGKSTVFAGS